MFLPYIAGAVIGVVILSIVIYYIARHLKGKLILEISRSSANSGESFAGRIDLTTKKATRGFLKVSLVGREKRRTRRAGDDNDRVEWKEIYRQDQIVEETRDFPAGFHQTYQFEITAPTAAEARRGGAAIRQAAEGLGEGTMGSVLKMAANAADMFQGRVYWHLEARLDVPGVDLYAKQNASVNLLAE